VQQLDFYLFRALRAVLATRMISVRSPFSGLETGRADDFLIYPANPPLAVGRMDGELR
jgi:hypothetical protein